MKAPENKEKHPRHETARSCRETRMVIILCGAACAAGFYLLNSLNSFLNTERIAASVA